MRDYYFIKKRESICERFELAIAMILRPIVACFRAYLRVPNYFKISETAFAQILIEIQKFLDSFLILFEPWVTQGFSSWGTIGWVWIEHLF